MIKPRPRLGLALAGLLTLLAAGCGSPAAPAPGSAPLTVEQWKALPPPGKYDVDTLERLKDGDPKLREPQAWAKFSREVLLPAKKKDRAGEKG